MPYRRIIPCLDIRGGRVVKGVQFLGIRDAGDPVEAAARYDAEGADELVLLDINASHEGRGTMLDVVERVAGQVYIPFTVGGGISSLDQIKELLGGARTRCPSIPPPCAIPTSYRAPPTNSAVSAWCAQLMQNEPPRASLRCF